MKAICNFRIGDNYNRGDIFGYILFDQMNGFSRITFDLGGFKPNKSHAIHIHEYSDLSNGCISLGGHYNPTERKHGNIWIHRNDRHAGDLINNLRSGEDGKFVYTYLDPLVNVKDIVGRSIVIHEGIDDLGLYRNDMSVSKEQREGSSTTGNAGGRMACAIIKSYQSK